MKNLAAFIAVIGLIIFAAGCKKDSNPAGTTQSYIDRYASNVQLIDTAGTTFTGDFFPLNVGDLYYYSGEQSMTVTGPGSSSPASSNDPIYGTSEVLSKRLVPLPSGADSLYPIVDNMTDTSRFSKKDTIAVYIKAFKMPDGSFSEVTDPIFIKSRLVVGDSWNAAPRFDLAKALASQNMQGATQMNLYMDARSKFFVIGKETINLPAIGNRSSIRLEQANDISITGTVVSQGTTVNINMSSQFAAIYHVIADTGIVHQNVTGDINIRYSYGSTSASIHITITKSELLLSSITHGVYYIPSIRSSVKQLGPLNTPSDETLMELSKEITKAVIKGCSL